VTTKYWVDVNNPTGYAQVLQEIPPNNFPVQYYYGLELLERNDTNNSRAVRYYVYDGHGSVRALTDSSGNVTDTYDGVYPDPVGDAFGNEIHSTGTTPNNYLFAGEQYDPDLNLYYNRSRYLSTNTARFWTMDTYEGDPQSPLSLHKYLYGGADPVDNVDPRGNQIDDVMAGIAVSMTLDAMPTLQVATFVSLAKVEVHFDLLGKTLGTNYYHAYLLVRGPQGPPIVFRGGPSGYNPDPNWPVIRDYFGLVSKSADLGFGYLTSAGSGQPFLPGGPNRPPAADYPSGPNDDVANFQVPNPLLSYDQVIESFTNSAHKIDSLQLQYHPISQNSNSFAHTLIIKANLISPEPSFYVPGWDEILY